MHQRPEKKVTKIKSFDIKTRNEDLKDEDNVQPLKRDKFGAVVRVSLNDLNLVIKQLKIEEVDDNPQLQQKVWKEMEVCNSFRIRPDPYIVTCHDVWQSPNYYNMSMEWCDSSLKTEMQRDAIANQRPELCVIYLLSILYGLTACHEKGISMHRDLKPENILITHILMQKCLRLADFGTCSYLKTSKSFQGTNLYLAPEVWSFKHQEVRYEFIKQNGYLTNCDIWSLGVIMYQLYNGLNKEYGCLQFPFLEAIYHQMEDDKQYLQKVQSYYKKVIEIGEGGVEKRMLSWKKWKNLSQTNKKRMQCLQKIITKMLEPHPLVRYSFFGLYQDIEAMWNDLTSGLQGLSVVLDFERYYQIEKSQKKNHLASTVLV